MQLFLKPEVLQRVYLRRHTVLGVPGPAPFPHQIAELLLYHLLQGQSIPQLSKQGRPFLQLSIELLH